MSRSITIRKGFDLPLKGSAPNAISGTVMPRTVALCPDDFHGFTPKADVKEGDKVVCGQPLMHDKNHPDVAIVSPADGHVEAVVRGSRRKIERIVVSVDHQADATADNPLPASLSRTELIKALCGSGLWVWMRQLPYNIVPDPDVMPRDIFVTSFDSAPLASPLAMDCGSPETLAAGVALLRRLTDGHVYIGVDARGESVTVKGAETIRFKGPHPAGNAGVQVNHIDPVNKGETVWTMDIVTLAKIGRWVRTGRPDFSVVTAITGPEVMHPRVVRTMAGASLKPLLEGELPSDGVHRRVIAGNVLSGVRESADGYLRFPYRQVTVIAEGDDKTEFMGWASMSPAKMSISRTFPAGFMPRRKLSADALLHGSPRAMIMSGVYDRMVPMDILPEPLIKAILSHNIDDMEALGIYEVSPEDFALAEWADPSKLPLQKIVREGLDYMRKES